MIVLLSVLDVKTQNNYNYYITYNKYDFQNLCACIIASIDDAVICIPLELVRIRLYKTKTNFT